MRTILLVLLLAACTAAPEQAAPEQEEWAGRAYGEGTTAVVLSNMGDNDPARWAEFAPVLAAKGVTVLTYRYNYTSFSAAAAKGTLSDLQAAIAHARKKGATKIILIGASLGGMAICKVAGGADIAAIVLMASRLDLSAYDFVVSEQELSALTMPKLIITSDNDDTTPYAATREVFDRAPEPKEFHRYPSTAHGVRLFGTEHANDLRRRLSEFVAAHA